MTEWLTVYDLRADEAQLERLQSASAGPGPHGIAPEPAVAGSAAWFDAIASGALPSGETAGTVSGVFWGSMADWPEFTITDDAGATSDWTREGDIRRYVPGIAGRVRWVEVRLGGVFAAIDLPESHRMAIQIDLESSDERASGIAPGPGGAGWKMIGGPETVVSYVQCPSARSTKKMRKRLERLGKVHQWAGDGGSTWLRVAGAAGATVWDTVDGTDATFDGYEVVREHGPPEVFGPGRP